MTNNVEGGMAYRPTKNVFEMHIFIMNPAEFEHLNILWHWYNHCYYCHTQFPFKQDTYAVKITVADLSPKHHANK